MLFRSLGAAGSSLHRAGVLITRGNAIEGLANATDIVFDKTGTLTTGNMHLHDVVTFGAVDRDAALALAAALEAGSIHPVARALIDSAKGGTELRADQLQHIAGGGIEGQIEGRRLRVGTPEFVAALVQRPLPESLPQVREDHTAVMLGDANGWIAQFAFADRVRENSSGLIAGLKAAGLRVHLVSGEIGRAHV